MIEETYNNHGIECPYCKHLHEPDEGWFYEEDGEKDFECHSCEKEFTWTHGRIDSWTGIPHPGSE